MKIHNKIVENNPPHGPSGDGETLILIGEIEASDLNALPIDGGSIIFLGAIPAGFYLVKGFAKTTEQIASYTDQDVCINEFKATN
jgi:hypothetical protein